MMHNTGLAQDYIRRAGVRLRALDVLFEGESWADVVRESQEIVELTLKALLRTMGIDPPRIHDVSGILDAERERVPDGLAPRIDRLISASKQLRRDRELAFYGAEDLTPSEFYNREDAEQARASARDVVEAVKPYVPVTEDASSNPPESAEAEQPQEPAEEKQPQEPTPNGYEAG